MLIGRETVQFILESLIGRFLKFESTNYRCRITKKVVYRGKYNLRKIIEKENIPKRKENQK